MNPRVFREYDIRGIADARLPRRLRRRSRPRDRRPPRRRRAPAASRSDATAGSPRRASTPRCKRELLASGLDVIDVGIVHTPGAVLLGLPPRGRRRRHDHRQPQPGRGQRLQDRLRARRTIYGAEIQKLRERIETRAFRTGVAPGKASDHDILKRLRRLHRQQHPARPAPVQGRRRRRQRHGRRRRGADPEDARRRRRRTSTASPTAASPTTTPIRPCPRTSPI